MSAGGAFEHVPYEVLVVAERVGERDSRGCHHGFALQRLVVDGRQKGAQQVFADERRKNVLVGRRVAVFDYPQNDGPAQSLFFKPPFEAVLYELAGSHALAVVGNFRALYKVLNFWKRPS